MLLLGCGGGGGGDTKPKIAITLELDPMAPSLLTGESATYVANVRIPGAGVNLYSDERFGIQWSTTGGTLAPVPGQNIAWRTYTAPGTPGTYQVTLQSTYDPSITKVSTVTVARPPVAQSLTADRTDVMLGDRVTLTPLFSDGVGTLVPGGTVLQSGVPVQVSPLRSTDYQLVVTNAIGRTATRTRTVSVLAQGEFAPLPVWTPSDFGSHGEALLPDGKVLVVTRPLSGVSRAYLLDPATWQFTAAPSNPSGSYGNPALAALADGRVLVFDLSRTWGGADLYSPVDGTFSPVDLSSLVTDGLGLTKVVPLSGGRTLLVGFRSLALLDTVLMKAGAATTLPGSTSPSLAVPYAGGKALLVSGSSYQVYDADAGTFSASLAFPWDMGSPSQAVRLMTGKILLTGAWSYSTGGSTVATLLDTATGALTAATPLILARDEYTLPVLLHDGRVLLAGRRLDATPVELFDPATGVSCQLPPMDTMVDGYNATVLSDGRVLLLGRTTGAVFDPNALPPPAPRLGTFSQTGTLVVPRSPGAMVLLPSGKALVTGGGPYTSTAQQSAVELYNPATGTFQRLGDLLTPRSGHTATLLASGKVLLFGGGGGLNQGSLPVAELYDPATGASQGLPFPVFSKTGHRAVALSNGKVLIVGGGDRNSYLFDPADNSLTPSGLQAGTGIDVGAALLPDGRVLVVDGISSGQGAWSMPGEIYDPATGLFTLTGTMGTASTGADLVALGNGKILALTYAAAECYAPAQGAFVPSGGPLFTRDRRTPPVLLADGTVLVFQQGSALPTQIYLPTLNGGLGGFVQGAAPLPGNLAFPGALRLDDGRVLVVETLSCQIYTP